MVSVGVVLDKDLRENVLKINRVLDRLMVEKINVRNKLINIISTSVPQVGLGEDIKAEYGDSFKVVVGACDRSEKTIVGGDMNANVGEDRSG